DHLALAGPAHRREHRPGAGTRRPGPEHDARGPMTATLPGPFQAAGLATGPDVAPGTMPAWAVGLSNDDGKVLKQSLTVGSDSYHGSVSASLPFDLEGGRYEVVIEGLTDEDYQRIRLTNGTLAAAIHLWWGDTPAGVLGDLARAAGLGDVLGGGT